MRCRVDDLRHKDVINVKDGTRLGSVCDVEIDTTNARVAAVVIYGKLRLLGILGREDDIVIQWKDIEVVGDDTILVSYNDIYRVRRRAGFWSSLFHGS